MNEKLAEIELLSYSIIAESLDKSDTMVFLTKMGLPLDIATRLLSLWDKIGKVGDKIISIGKIILLKIIDFIKENPTMAIGMAIGGCLGFLLSWIPGLGLWLIPIFAIVGGVCGLQKDEINTRDPKSDVQAIFNLLGDSLEVIKKSLQLIVDIFKAVKMDLIND